MDNFQYVHEVIICEPLPSHIIYRVWIDHLVSKWAYWHVWPDVGKYRKKQQYQYYYFHLEKEIQQNAFYLYFQLWNKCTMQKPEFLNIVYVLHTTRVIELTQILF